MSVSIVEIKEKGKMQVEMKKDCVVYLCCCVYLCNNFEDANFDELFKHWDQ